MEGNFYKLGIIWTFFGRAWISHNCLENCDIYIYIEFLITAKVNRKCTHFCSILTKNKKIIESYTVTHFLLLSLIEALSLSRFK